MKEMRLFEIGFKGNPRRNGYEHKFYVAAENSHNAEQNARNWVIEDYMAWWEEEGCEMERIERMVGGQDKSVAVLCKVRDIEIERLRGLCLSKLLDIGTLIV